MLFSLYAKSFNKSLDAIHCNKSKSSGQGRETGSVERSAGVDAGEKGRRSGWSARLPRHQCDPGSILARCQMWVSGFAIGFCLNPRAFPRSGLSGFLPSARINISQFQFDQDRWLAWKPAEADVHSSLNVQIYFLFMSRKYDWLLSIKSFRSRAIGLRASCDWIFPN